MDNQESLLHMYSILDGRSRIPPNTLSYTGHVSSLTTIPAKEFLPIEDDFINVQQNLIIIVSRMLTQYIKGLSVFAKAVPQHIQHQYSTEMGRKSEVIVLDVLMKNEACRGDMIEIMHCMQNYLGIQSEYPSEKKVLSGGDQLTCKRQVGAQRHTMDGDTVLERLGLLEPVIEDWHCMVCLLSVRSCMCIITLYLIIVCTCIYIYNDTLTYTLIITHTHALTITPCTCARGKVISLYVCRCRCRTKITRSRDIGTDLS